MHYEGLHQKWESESIKTYKDVAILGRVISIQTYMKIDYLNIVTTKKVFPSVHYASDFLNLPV